MLSKRLFVVLLIVVMALVGVSPTFAAGNENAEVRIQSVANAGTELEAVSLTVTRAGLLTGYTLNDVPLTGSAFGNFTLFTQTLPAGSPFGSVALGNADPLFTAGGQAVLKFEGNIVSIYSIDPDPEEMEDCPYRPVGGSTDIELAHGSAVQDINHVWQYCDDGVWVTTPPTGVTIVYLSQNGTLPSSVAATATPEGSGQSGFMFNEPVDSPEVPAVVTVTPTPDNAQNNQGGQGQGGGQPTAQVGQYDVNWLRSLGNMPNADAITAFNLVWEATTNVKGGVAGNHCDQIPAGSGVIGSMDTVNSNTFAFASIQTNIWYSVEGGRFCTTEGNRWMHLDLSDAGVSYEFLTLQETINAISAMPVHSNRIVALDVAWGRGDGINRWGSYAPTGQELCETFPAGSHIIAWGEKSSGTRGFTSLYNNIHFSRNGGTFCTRVGYRAMQFAVPSN